MIRRRSWLVTGIVVALFLSLAPMSAPPITGLFGCTTTTRHARWALKTRPAPDSLTSAEVVSVSDLLGWAVPRGHRASEVGQILPHEARLVRLTGIVRRVKLSPDDCDLHIEIAATGAAGAPRFIAEIPPTAPNVQRAAAVIFHLSAQATSHTYSSASAVTVTVTGYVFLDLSHQCTGHPTVGCQHGSADVRTLWEVHPVVAIGIVK